MMTTHKTPRALSKTLTAIRDRAARMEADARAERIEADRAIRQLARGTREVAPVGDVAASVARAGALTLAEKIEAVLRGPFAPLDIRAIAAAVDEPAARVAAHLKKLRAMLCPTRSLDDAADARQIYNLGSDDDPRWIWVVGDETSPEDLSNVVRKMLGLKPMTFAELTLATGARRGRLSGRLVQFGRDREHLENVEEPEVRPARWYMPASPTKRGRSRRATARRGSQA